MVWIRETLGDICREGGGRIQTGPFGSQLHESDYSMEGIPVVMPADIIDGKVSTTRIVRVSENHVERLKRHKLSKGDIVYGRRGDIGRQALVKEENAGWLCGTGCLKISLGAGPLTYEFLHRYLSTSAVIGWIEGQAIGATMPNLNTGILERVPVFYPRDHVVQKKIAAILSAYDDLIENNQRRIALLEKMAEQIYREWFVRLRFPGHEEVKKVKGLPEGWGFSPLREMFDFLEGPGIRNWQYTASGVPFINIRLISDGDIDVASANCVSENEGNGRYAHFHLQARDYVVSTSGTLGRGAIVQEYHLPLMLNTSVVRFRPKKKDHYGFMYGYLKSDTFIRQVEMYASGAAQQNFGPSHLNLMQILKPKDELLAQFEKIVIPLFDQIYAIRSATRNLQATRDALLPRLISGKLFVEHLDIQFPPGMEDRP